MKDFVSGAAARKLPNLDPDLNEIVGRPTGQGFGASRKGPSVVASSDKALMKEEDVLWLNLKVFPKPVKWVKAIL